jgi:outer membrane protein assembly factor BamB
LALLDHSGIPQAGWPVVLADTISCQFLLPVADGSVRVVCTLENPGNLYNPMGALAFDSKGAMLAGWPADLGCCITDGRLVGDELVLLQSSPTSDVPVPAGQPVAIEQVLTVATDGSIRGGTGVPVFAGEPDGVADDIALASGFDDGIESGPALRPDGRIVITVGSYEQGATRVVVFDADRKAVLARSAELPMASVEKPSDLDVCVVRTPSPPIVAADGTVFVFSELDPRVFALDPSLEVKGGWPYRPATPLVRDSFDASCDPRGIPAVGPDSTLYLPLEASDATAGGSLVAVGPDGRVRPGWPVELSRPGAEFWSVVVGSDGTVYALAVEPRPSNGFSASILAIAPDSTVLWTTTIIDA